MERIFKIIPDREENFFAQLEKLAKKFSVVYQVINTEYVEPKKGFPFLSITIDIAENRLKFSGFKFIASVEKVDKENIVFTAEGIDYKKYTDMSIRCDHCKRNIANRKYGYIFLDESGNELMIAKTCVKDYFGQDVDKHLKQFFIFTKYLDELLETEEKEYSGGKMPVDIKELVKISFAVMVDNGRYVSAKQDEYTNTLSMVHYAMAQPRDKAQREYQKTIHEIANAFNPLVILKYWEEKEVENNFEHNVKLSFRQWFPKEIFIVCGVWSYMKNVMKFNQVNRKIKNEHVGNIKEKISVNVEVVAYKKFDTMYGESILYTFISETDHVFKWFSSSDKNLETGQKINLTGTIKKHDVYKEEKSTVLTRCKIK